MEDYSLLKTLKDRGIIDQEAFNNCSRLESLSNVYKIYVPLLLPLFLKSLDEPSLFHQILGAKFDQIDGSEVPLQYTIPDLDPREIESVLGRLREQGVLEEKLITESKKEAGCSRMGFSLNPIDILIGQRRLSWDIIKERLASLGITRPYSHVPMKFEILVPEEKKEYLDIETLAIHSGLVSEEEITKCRLIIDRLNQGYGIKVQIQRLFYEKLLMDRRWIFSLLRTRLRLQRIMGMNAVLRRRLTEEGDYLLAKKVRNGREEQVDRGWEIQKTLKEWRFSFSLGEILVSMGVITDEILESLALSDILRQEGPKNIRTQFVVRDPSTPIGCILKESGLVSDVNMAECVIAQKRCQEKFGFTLPLGEWIVAKGYINHAELTEALIASQSAKLKEELDMALIRFNPLETYEILKKLEAYITPQIKEQYGKLKIELAGFGLSWNMADYLYMKGAVSPNMLKEILESRKVLYSETLSFPGWVYGKDREADIGRLAVANNFLAYEEYLQSYSIQHRCEEQWEGKLPVDQILIKKGILNPSLCFDLIKAQKKQGVYQEWLSYLLPISLNPNETNKIKNRALKECVLSQQEYDNIQSLEDKLETNAVSVLMIQRRIPQWIYRDIEEKYKSEFLIFKDFSEPSFQIQFISDKDSKQVTWEQLDNRVLSSQWFGELAIEAKLISNATLKDALFLQGRFYEMGLDRKIGEILWDMKAITLPSLHRVLRNQKEIKEKLKWPQVNVDDQVDFCFLQNIIEAQVLPPEEMKRILYIYSQYRRIGIEKSLIGVVRERNLLDPEILKGLAKKKEIEFIQEEEKKVVEGAKAPSQKIVPHHPPLAKTLAKTKGSKEFDKTQLLKALIPSLCVVLLLTVGIIYLGKKITPSGSGAVNAKREPLMAYQAPRTVNTNPVQDSKIIDTQKDLPKEVVPKELSHGETLLKMGSEGHWVVVVSPEEPKIFYKGEWMRQSQAYRLASSETQDTSTYTEEKGTESSEKTAKGSLPQDKTVNAKKGSEKTTKGTSVQDKKSLENTTKVDTAQEKVGQRYRPMKKLPDSWYLPGKPDMKLEKIDVRYGMCGAPPRPTIGVAGILSPEFTVKDQGIWLDIHLCPIDSPLNIVTSQRVQSSPEGHFLAYLLLSKPPLKWIYHIRLEYNPLKQGNSNNPLPYILQLKHYTHIIISVGTPEEIEEEIERQTQTFQSELFDTIHKLYKQLAKNAKEAYVDPEKARARFDEWAVDWERDCLKLKQNIMLRNEETLILPFPKAESNLKMILENMIISYQQLRWGLFKTTLKDTVSVDEAFYDRSFEETKDLFTSGLSEIKDKLSLLKQDRK